jgi:hypothetical protein
MRAFSCNAHWDLIRAADDPDMEGIRLSRAALALLIIGVLIGGVVLGSVVSAVARPTATPDPTPSVSLMPSVTAGPLPDGDVAGEDLPRLPRYPGSVRTEYEVSIDDRFRLTATEYMADATLDEVRAFYQGVIEDHGWQRADIDFSGGEWTYVLVDGATEALIELEVSDGFVEIDLQVSVQIATPAPDPTPPPTALPTPPPATPPTDDDDDGDDDGDDDDDGSDDDDGDDTDD